MMCTIISYLNTQDMGSCISTVYTYTVDAGVLRRVLVVLGYVTNKMSRDQLTKLRGVYISSMYMSVYVFIRICVSCQASNVMTV